MQIIKVLIPKNGLFPLDYQVQHDVRLSVGDLILAPIRDKCVTGIVWEINVPASDKKLKAINPPPIPNDDIGHVNLGRINLELIRKAAEYYLFPLGSIAKLALPVDINEKPLISEIQEIHDGYSLPVLSQEQTKALDVIAQAKSPILLKGVTGSGKTEVYFHRLAEYIKAGRQVLIMLPEISLSSQIINRFTQRFGFKPAVWNSQTTKARKKKLLRGILSGGVKAVIGARSSLFLPYRDLALIVVDEEHDASYKQAEGVLYNARDMAVLRAHLAGTGVVLVSATPSIETVYNVQQGKYKMVELKSRFSQAQLPGVEIIDMRSQKLAPGSWLSPPLVESIKLAIAQGQQCLLFLNRRGYAPLTLCKLCGYRFGCKTCSASMVTHKAKKKMQCHHCGAESRIHELCPECKAPGSLVLCGPGVERVYEETAKLFPDLRIKIASREQATRPEEMQLLLQEMETGVIDILIGTQIIAKGYHFPKLSLVGVIDADLGFFGGDLRSTERTFQLLHQVGGRAGRTIAAKGKVLFQTYFPESKVLTALASKDEEGFIEREMHSRQRAKMPPFAKMAAINISGRSPEKTLSLAKYIAFQAPRADARILGPAESLLFKLAGRHRYRLLIISEKNFNLQKYLTLWMENCKIPSAFQVKIDIDPYNFY